MLARLKLEQAVLTSVTRDDLPDGGASVFARTIELLRRQDKDVKEEFLIGDLRGRLEALKIVLESRVDVLGHNVGTGPLVRRSCRAFGQSRALLEKVC